MSFNSAVVKHLSLGSILSLIGLFSAPAQANETQVFYNLAAGTTSAPITIPGVNTPISVTCVQNTVGNRGVGQATVLRVNPPAFLEWVGLDVANAGAPSTGFSASAGVHVIYCDFSKAVDLQVESAVAIQIKNTSSTQVTGVINFVW